MCKGVPFVSDDNKPKILIVDDEPMNIELMEESVAKIVRTF